MIPISLDELVARAELLSRHDRKYVLPPAVLGGLPASTRVLEIDGRREFTYRSVYFDTPELVSYLGAAYGRRRRFKLRLRSYLETGQEFVEVKTRGPRGMTVKTRFPYGSGAFAEAAVVLGGNHCFSPTLTTHYRRSTYFLPADGSRVTVDVRPAWTLPDGTGLHLPECVIVETKTAHAAGAADRLLWAMRRRPVAISKYATGLAALRPELPANRWLPVLRRYFPVSPALSERTVR
jgi:hypothetical protein